MAEEVLKVSGLTREFGDLVAVNHVSFEVKQGEIFGFLGPNGAGKTTTINMLTTVLRPTSGEAHVCSYDITSHPSEVRECIGVVPQEYTADEDLTGEENLMLCAALYDIPRDEARKRMAELLDLVQLTEAKGRKVDTYSGGMRRRLELAAGLINHPKVLFLDEPTLGLDVQTRTAVWDYIKMLKQKYNMTLFMTTHYLEEADQVCDRIAIIDHGRIVAIDTPAELKNSLGGDIVEVQTSSPYSEEVVASLREIPGVRDVAKYNESYRMKAVNGEETAPLILDKFRSLNLKITRIAIVKPTLDDVYLERTGRSIREENASKDEAFKRRALMRRARQ